MTPARPSIIQERNEEANRNARWERHGKSRASHTPPPDQAVQR